jgi:uncharacterized protein YacL (UPF0231 family)
MSDLVERLREIGNGIEYDDIKPTCDEAAETIAALRAEKQSCIAQANDLATMVNEHRAEIDTLHYRLINEADMSMAEINSLRAENDRLKAASFYYDETSDTLCGLAAIAKFLNITERQAEHWVERGWLPTKRMGRTVVARRSRLLAVIDEPGDLWP